MVNGKPLNLSILSFLNMIRINTCLLPTWELFYPFIGLILPIYWVLISLIVRLWSYEVWFVIDLLAEINAIMEHVPKLQLSSTTSNLILSRDYNRSKDPLVEGCVKQRCGKEYSELSDLIYNDRSFVNFELFLVKSCYVFANFYLWSRYNMTFY